MNFINLKEQIIYAKTLLIGLVGGYIFYKLNMPIAFMLGAIVFNLCFALAGIKVKVYDNLVKINLLILGTFLGSKFSPEIIDNVANWYKSILLLGFFVLLCVVILYQYFSKIIKLDKKTAFFSSSPGGMTNMIFIGKDLGADDKIIAVVHAVRVFMVVFIIPFGFRIFTNLENNIPKNITKSVFDYEKTPELITLFLLCLVGSFVAKKIKFPAPFLTGAMTLSIYLHINNYFSVEPPEILLNIVQIILGSSIGARFYKVDAKKLYPIILASVGSTSILIVTGLLFAFFIKNYMDVPIYALILGFTPGGVADMCMISLALGIDVAFVSIHHIMRIIYIVSFMPFFIKNSPKK